MSAEAWRRWIEARVIEEADEMGNVDGAEALRPPAEALPRELLEAEAAAQGVLLPCRPAPSEQPDWTGLTEAVQVAALDEPAVDLAAARRQLASHGELPPEALQRLAALAADDPELAAELATFHADGARLAPSRPSLPAGFWDEFTSEVLGRALVGEALEPAELRAQLPLLDELPPAALARAEQLLDGDAELSRAAATQAATLAVLRGDRPALGDGFWDGFTAEVQGGALLGQPEQPAGGLEAGRLVPRRPELPADFWDGFTTEVQGSALFGQPEQPAGGLEAGRLVPQRPELPADFWDGFTARTVHAAMPPLAARRPSADRFSAMRGWLAAAAVLLGAIAIGWQASQPGGLFAPAQLETMAESGGGGELTAPVVRVAPYRVRTVGSRRASLDSATARHASNGVLGSGSPALEGQQFPMDQADVPEDDEAGYEF